VANLTVTLIGKTGCHLCDDADLVVRDVLRDYDTVTLTHANLDDNPAWVEQYSDKIPVVLVQGREHTYWRVNTDELRRELDTLLALSSDQNSE
jgi:hypothetical protein